MRENAQRNPKELKYVQLIQEFSDCRELVNTFFIRIIIYKGQFKSDIYKQVFITKGWSKLCQNVTVLSILLSISITNALLPVFCKTSLPCKWIKSHTFLPQKLTNDLWIHQQNSTRPVARDPKSVRFLTFLKETSWMVLYVTRPGWKIWQILSILTISTLSKKII